MPPATGCSSRARLAARSWASGSLGSRALCPCLPGRLDAMPSLDEQKKPNKKGGVVGQVAPLPQQQAAAPQLLQQVLGR